MKVWRMDEGRGPSHSACTKLPFGSVLIGRRVLDPDSDPPHLATLDSRMANQRRLKGSEGKGGEPKGEALQRSRGGR